MIRIICCVYVCVCSYICYILRLLLFQKRVKTQINVEVRTGFRMVVVR